MSQMNILKNIWIRINNVEKYKWWLWVAYMDVGARAMQGAIAEELKHRPQRYESELIIFTTK